MRRSAKGQSLIEFTVSTVLLVPITLMLVDASLLIYSMQLNDTACNEACRLASIGDPRFAVARAKQSLLAAGVVNTQSNNPELLSLRLVKAGSTVSDSQLQALRPYGGPVSGEVSVVTEVSIRPFFLTWFLGGAKKICFQSKQEIPTTYVVPNQPAHSTLQTISSAETQDQDSTATDLL